MCYLIKAAPADHSPLRVGTWYTRLAADTYIRGMGAFVEWQRSEQGTAEASQYIYGDDNGGAHEDMVMKHLIASSAARGKRE